GDLHDRLAQIGAALLVKTLIDIENGIVQRTEQDDKKATYAPRMDKNFGEINWRESAEKIFNLVRGLNPWPGAFTYTDGKLLKIWLTEILDKYTVEKEPGTILKANDNKGLLVQTGQGIIKIKNLQLEGRKKMSVEDFLRGYDLEEGEKLG
ncbi:MAG: methionyl-tRNA formyltransferase, partial [Bacillota bacterium]